MIWSLPSQLCQILIYLLLLKVKKHRQLEPPVVHSSNPMPLPLISELTTTLFFFLMLFLSAYILFMYVCMYVWLCWVFVSVRGLSLAVASGGHSSSRCGVHSSSRCAGLSPSRPPVAKHRLQTHRLSNRNHYPLTTCPSIHRQHMAQFIIFWNFT